MSARPKREAAKRARDGLKEPRASDIYHPASVAERWQEDWESDGEHAESKPPRKKEKQEARKPEERGKNRGNEEKEAGGKRPLSRRERTEELQRFIAQARNANTHATYSSGWRQFEKWAREVENLERAEGEEVSLERPSETDVAAYVRYLVVDKGRKMGTATAAVAAIADKLRYVTSEEYNPCNGKLVRDMKAALLPTAPETKQKKEVTNQQVKEITQLAVASGEATARRDACMILFAYQALLRGSEVARMDRGDITFEEREGRKLMKIHVNKLAKNDVERKGHERLVEEKEGTAQLCLVRIMRAYLESGGEGGKTDPLFPKEGGGRMKADTPRGRLKRWLGLIGVEDPEEYGFHSLRAGGATTAVRAGVSEREIKLHGNWRSDAVRLYMRPGTEERLSVSGATRLQED